MRVGATEDLRRHRVRLVVEDRVRRRRDRRERARRRPSRGSWNCCTRLLSASATVTRPLQDTEMPVGSMNCPGPTPRSPNAQQQLPRRARTPITRSLPRSATHTLPAPSSATSAGERRSPRADLGQVAARARSSTLIAVGAGVGAVDAAAVRRRPRRRGRAEAPDRAEVGAAGVVADDPPVAGVGDVDASRRRRRPPRDGASSCPALRPRLPIVRMILPPRSKTSTRERCWSSTYSRPARVERHGDRVGQQRRAGRGRAERGDRRCRPGSGAGRGR